MPSITWESPRYVQELATILGPQNPTQRSCATQLYLTCVMAAEDFCLWKSRNLHPFTYLNERLYPLQHTACHKNVALFLLISNLLGFLRYCARKTASNLSPWYIWQRASEDFWKFKASLDISNYWSAFIRFARFMFWHQLRINHQLNAQHVYRKWSYSTCR